MMLYIFFLLTVCCYGFLLESKTQPSPTNSPLMSDKHFYMLMDLLNVERQHRRQMEQDILNLSNSTVHLQSEFNLLQTKYNKLQQDHMDLKRNHTVLKAHSAEIEQKISTFEQMKKCSDLQNVNNETNYLESAIQKTNTRLDTVVSEADARKHDIVALFDKELSFDEKLQNLSIQLGQNQAWTNETLNNMKLSFNNKWNDLSIRELTLENTTAQIQQKLNAATKKVGMTACTATSSTMKYGSVIPFRRIRQLYGIQDVSSVKSTGILSIEQEGLYLVMVNLVENGNAGNHFNIFLNELAIRQCFASDDTHWQESSCTTVIQLNIHDKISVKTASTMTLTSAFNCVTFVKVM